MAGNEKLGYFLGGGGYSGATSIGYLLAAYELGFKPDCVKGVSVGAIIAAGFIQSDCDPNPVKEIFTGLIEKAGARSIFNFRDPKVLWRFISGSSHLLDNDRLLGLVNGLNMDKIIASKRRFEVSTYNASFKRSEIFTNHEERVRRDPEILRKAILASASLPGFFCPVPINGQLYSDGIEISVKSLIDFGCSRVFIFVNDPKEHKTCKRVSWFIQMRGMTHQLNDIKIESEQARYGDKIVIFRVQHGIDTLSRTRFKKGDITRAIELGYEKGLEILRKV
ncbi:MAG: patatin-like phospholipase family protein [Elusimicrobiota bacterium]|nr:patatin-like phospholipase family protein [Elusimicrobiota bacterium]